MGNETACACFDDPRDNNQEFKIGTGAYSFKKMVSNINYINIFLILTDLVVAANKKSKNILWKR